MSTSWGLSCATCQVTAELVGHHADDFLRELYRNRAELIAVHRLLQTNNMWRLELRMLSGTENPVEFLAEHAGHHIQLHNEYGHDEDMEAPC